MTTAARGVAAAVSPSAAPTLRAAKTVQISLRGSIGRGFAHEVAPYRGCLGRLTIAGINHREQVARRRLIRVQAQRLECLAPSLRQAAAFFIDERQIEMCFGMILAQKDCALEAGGRSVEIALFELNEAKIRNKSQFLSSSASACRYWATSAARSPRIPRANPR